MTRLLCPSLWALVLLATVPPARGVAFRVPDQDARAIACGNAFAATADNPSAIYYNPAGVGFLENAQFRASAYPIWLKVGHDPAAGVGRVSTRDQLQGVAQVYVTKPLGSEAWNSGVGLYTPYGLGTTQPDDAPFRALGTKAEFAAGGARFEQDATYRLNFPQHLVAGWSYRPTPAWNFEVNVDWTEWHAVDTATLGLPGGDTEVRFDWESGFIYEFGVTRTLGPRLALSAGYWYAEQTIPDARYKPIVPDVALHVFSAGAAWRWGAWDLEAVYQLGFGPTRTVRGSEDGLADGDFTYLSHALSLAVGRKF